MRNSRFDLTIIYSVSQSGLVTVMSLWLQRNYRGLKCACLIQLQSLCVLFHIACIKCNPFIDVWSFKKYKYVFFFLRFSVPEEKSNYKTHIHVETWVYRIR